MAHQSVIICFLIAYLQVSFQASTEDVPTYRGAVVEFPPVFIANDTKSMLQQNSDSYVNFIQEAGEENVDIIVFPEDGLTTIHLPTIEHMDPWTTLIPDPTENYVPCDKDTIPVSETLKKISCAAKNNKIYVVINIAEKFPCSGAECPESKVLYYNSNVVFDRTGKIIARYRKTHLFIEPTFSVTSKPEIVTFDTDFGVKFGTFICFDILFKEPALTLSRKLNITDFVYSTAWFSEMPFLTAVQAQMGWAWAENVHLLAAGYNNPKQGSGGSGIYIGNEKIAAAVMPKTMQAKILVADIPKKSKNNTAAAKRTVTHPAHANAAELRKKREDVPTEVNEFKLTYDNFTMFTMMSFNSSVQQKVCQSNFCCEFKIELENVDPGMMYKIVATNGLRSYDRTHPVGVTACGVIQCTNDDPNSCGSMLESKTFFKTIQIFATFENSDNMLIMPSMLDPSLLPLKEFEYEVHHHENHAHVSVTLTVPRNNIITFGIYARDFSKDKIDSSASIIGAQGIMFVITLWVLSRA